MEEVIKTIDVGQVIRKSNSGFIRSLPPFIVRLIEKFIHQDEMNNTIYNNRFKTGVPFVNAILKEWNVNVTVKGGDNIPEAGKFVFVANHPVGAMDALSFLSAIYMYFPNVISPSNQLFNYIPQLKPVILGVNVFGRNTRETADKLNQLFESESQVMIFPAGEVSRRHNGTITDPVWQKTFIAKAVAYKRDIIPVHISGRNSNLFYFIAAMRKSLGIKLYLETMLLPREMMRQRNSIVTLAFGKPIPWQMFTGERSHSEWAQHIKEQAYLLADS